MSQRALHALHSQSARASARLRERAWHDDCFDDASVAQIARCEGAVVVSMNWESFTPWSALAGGALIGIAASILLVLTGRVAGISGVLGGLLVPRAGEVAWRAAFVVGLLLGGLAVYALSPDSVGASPRGLSVVAVAGVLVGVGTRIGNGCTSGHGVCGLSRFSSRSLVATLTFMASGILAASAARVLGAGT